MRTVLACAMGLAGGAILCARLQAAPPQSAQPDLLTEVRALRVAMEQLASAAPRAQIALGRLQMQEARIATLAQQLGSVRNELRDDVRGLHTAELKAEQAQLQQQIASEQARWSNLSQRLDELERSVARK